MRSLDVSIIRTKFLPHSSNKGYWKKPDLWQKYADIENYPLTVVKAGPGYGKSSSLATFLKEKGNCYWYNVDEMDADPALFFLNVFCAFHSENQHVSQTAIDVLLQHTDTSTRFMKAINHFINDLVSQLKSTTYFVIDDFHLVGHNEQIQELLAHFIRLMPHKLRLIIATRENLKFKEFASWRLKKTVLVIDEKDLALNSQNIAEFFEDQHGLVVSPNEAKLVADESEGWVIALDLLGQELKQGAKLSEILGKQTKSLDLLFEYLAFEILETQPVGIQEFLLKTATLKHLIVSVCNQLLGIENSQEILDDLVERGLFVYPVSAEQYRHHHLVHEFLQKLGRERYDYKGLHRRAAEIYLQRKETGLAIYHSLEAQDHEQATGLILSSANKMLELGRLDSLQASLDELPETMFARYPLLHIFQGDVLRLRGLFNNALEVYGRARKLFLERQELLYVGMAAQKLAMVYLDTVQPVKADTYLQEALHYRNGEDVFEEANLLRLMAENKANEGRLDEAALLTKQAELLDKQEKGDSNIRARILLRTGKLEEALVLLEGKLAEEKAREMASRSHRETILILSFIQSLVGEIELAHDYATSGIELGKRFNSPFIMAVGYMRLGHSYQLQGRHKLSQARKAYHDALQIVDELEITRSRAEPLLGLSLLEGFSGDSNLGLKYAEEGLAISDASGDKWMGAMLKIALGINFYFLERFDQAPRFFQSAEKDFGQCRDALCLLVSQLWLAQTYFTEGQLEGYDKTIKQIFESPQNEAYLYLFKKPTLLGIRDKNAIAPLLLDASRRLEKNHFLQELLAEKGLVGVDYHPGYSLRINSFGNLRLWRGKSEIGDKEWPRKKALELFLLLLIHRGKYLSREQLYNYLWPEDDGETAARNFKVALNALKMALEPDRKPREESFFIIKNRSNYSFNEESGYIFDAEEFEQLIEEGNAQQDRTVQMDLYRSAIELYHGDFMADIFYVDWITDERERLQKIFLRTVDKLANYYYAIEDNEEALKMADLLLANDLCWEPAYLLKMKVYQRLNQRFIAIKIYQQCKQVLDRELNVLPMPEIEKLYRNLVS